MFKKHSSHALRAAVCAALAALSCALPAAAQQKSVAVTSIVEHPALDAVRDGVKEALQKACLLYTSPSPRDS